MGSCRNCANHYTMEVAFEKGIIGQSQYDAYVEKKRRREKTYCAKHREWHDPSNKCETWEEQVCDGPDGIPEQFR